MLTKDQRKGLPASDFAVPELRKLPIHDATHVRLAWDMVDRTSGLSDSQRKAARKRIVERAEKLGVDTEDWDIEKSSVHAQMQLLSAVTDISAMSLAMPDVKDHPNRMPFKGVLTFVDQPSDAAPSGSGGRRTYLPSDVAATMIPSLIGMAIDHTPDLDGHDPQQKIGVITGADVIGNELRIEGFFYAADFPQVCDRIREEKEDLGFSYEIKAQTLPMVGGLLQIVGGTFTGAAVLYKDKAAYTRTSLAAKADQELDMTPEEMKKLFGDVIAPLAASVEKLSTELADVKKVQAEAEKSRIDASKTHDMVRPHAEKLRDCAASMEAAGIGGDANRGHVKVVRHMADQMEADAVMGKVPHIYRDHDFFSAARAHEAPDVTKQVEEAVTKATEALKKDLAAATTTIADLKAKGFTEAASPERKTVPADVTTLLAKHGLTKEAEDGKLTVAQVDATLEKAGMSSRERIAAKLRLQAAGVLPQARAAA